MLATTKIAMNSASPPNDAVTAISVVRASWSSGYSALPRASPVSTTAPPAAARSREASKPGAASTPIASTRPGMAGQPRRLGVGQEDRRLLPDGVAGPGDADHGDGAGGLGGREAQPRAELGAVAGDDLVGPGGRAPGAQHVGRQRGAAPAVGDRGRGRRAGPAPTRRRSRPGRRERPPAERRARSSRGRARRAGRRGRRRRSAARSRRPRRRRSARRADGCAAPPRAAWRRPSRARTRRSAPPGRR